MEYGVFSVGAAGVPERKPAPQALALSPGRSSSRRVYAAGEVMKRVGEAAVPAVRTEQIWRCPG
jgi:hypothetical protein